MLRNIHLTKALVLVSILVLIGIIGFNKIIEQNRIDLFQKYSTLVLPPDYDIKQNRAGTGDYRTNVVLVFQFDDNNFENLLRQNNINDRVVNSNQSNVWKKDGKILVRQRKIDSRTTLSEK
ncbi:MAG: hypothetical protein JWQ14_3032 [Adhaeribacter sp.]|nr:hypothetical protein [Adhaeribacter sp.]